MSRPVPTLLVVAAAGVTVLLLVRVEAPGDLGRWSTAALHGEPVLAVVDTGEAVVAGGHTGLVVLDGGGAGSGPRAAADHATPGPVQALAISGDRIWVGTEDGLGELTEDGYRPVDLPATGEGVHALHAAPDGTLLAGTATGLHRIDPGAGESTRLWPAPGEPDQPVDAVLSVDGSALLDHPEGLARLTPDGEVRVLEAGVDVVALGALAGPDAGPAAGTLWAGLRGGPLLLVSEDGGDSWRESGEGLGFNATNALAAGRADDTDNGTENVGDGSGSDGGTVLRAGGSGLADGTGQAGVMTSTDGGRTWQADQDRLSNTHVTGLLARREPVTLGLRIAGGRLGNTDVPLPVTTTRWYAATNGSGVTTQRPAAPALEAAAPLLPVLRLAEPLLLGTLLLALTVAAYRQARMGPLPRPDPAATRGAGTLGNRPQPGPYPEPGPDPHSDHPEADNDPDPKENPHA